MISPNPESVLCHCLRITVGQVQCAIEENRPNSVRDVMRMTGAGKGCMSCHSRIKAMLAGRMPVSTFQVPGCTGCANPACGCAPRCATEVVTTTPDFGRVNTLDAVADSVAVTVAVGDCG
ncbi:MAG: (2Fe-2S)-binding protein [Planctomycetaceae bacterium]|nr:(2Fe-2S)-binding protein [Planctomycetaceae bacterium]